MKKNLIVILIVFLGLFLVVLIWSNILVNKYKGIGPKASIPRIEGKKDADRILKTMKSSLKSSPTYSKPSKKKEEPVEEIEILPPGQKPGVLVN